MVKLVLTYFPLKARAYAIRLALHIGDVPFTDERLPFTEWGAKKGGADADKDFPMGQLPVLKVDDKVLCQSQAILFYCGTLAKLVPTDAWGQTKVLEFLGCVEDVTVMLVPSLHEKDNDKKLKMRQELVAGQLPGVLSKMDKLVEANGHQGHVVGSNLTVADLSCYQLVSWFTSGVLDGIPKDVVNGYKSLMKVNAHVDENPKVKAYNAKDN